MACVHTEATEAVWHKFVSPKNCYGLVLGELPMLTKSVQEGSPSS